MEDPKNPSKNPFTNFKTATCKYYSLGNFLNFIFFNFEGTCKNGDGCSFAHGDNQLRLEVTIYIEKY